MVKYRDKLFYKIVKPPVKLLLKLLYGYKVVGINNIPREGRVLFAGNHTCWLDPVLIVCTSPRQVHFLAKEELFHGITNIVVNGMGCIPVNRKIHDHNALESAYKFLENELCIGIFPEGTINRTHEDVLLPFKMGAVKACNVTKTKLMPFVITGKYKLFRRNVKIEFFEPIEIGDDLEYENNKLRDFIADKILEEENKCQKKKK